LAVPVVTGTARTGNTLTTSDGSWTGSPTSYTYQWKRSATSTGVYLSLHVFLILYFLLCGYITYGFPLSGAVRLQ
jgi:hypothetical protein